MGRVAAPLTARMPDRTSTRAATMQKACGDKTSLVTSAATGGTVRQQSGLEVT